MDQAVHLYIHLPFCARRCGYCDFYSEAGALDRVGPYVGALQKELEGSGVVMGRLETVYLGGGTPTLIGPGFLEELLGAVLAGAAAEVEVTVEANPSTVTAELATRLRAAGVTRVSMGVQSSSPRLRENLGRGGDPGVVRVAVERLRAAGFGNIGLDMIFGIPGQEPADLGRDIDAVLALKPEHISYYELSAKEGGAYRDRWGAELDAMEESGRLFYETVVDSLEAAGYRWYETSNFALPGRECRHNLAYWSGADYIGLGAGAWSTLGFERWRNVEEIEAYITAAAGDGLQSSRIIQELTPVEKVTEKLFLGLRCREGVLRQLVEPVMDVDREAALSGFGLLCREGGNLVLTREGRFVANEVVAQLLKK